MNECARIAEEMDREFAQLFEVKANPTTITMLWLMPAEEFAATLRGVADIYDKNATKGNANRLRLRHVARTLRTAARKLQN